MISRRSSIGPGHAFIQASLLISYVYTTYLISSTYFLSFLSGEPPGHSFEEARLRVVLSALASSEAHFGQGGQASAGGAGRIGQHDWFALAYGRGDLGVAQDISGIAEVEVQED